MVNVGCLFAPDGQPSHTRIRPEFRRAGVSLRWSKPAAPIKFGPICSRWIFCFGDGHGDLLNKALPKRGLRAHVPHAYRSPAPSADGQPLQLETPLPPEFAKNSFDSLDESRDGERYGFAGYLTGMAR